MQLNSLKKQEGFHGIGLMDNMSKLYKIYNSINKKTYAWNKLEEGAIGVSKDTSEEPVLTVEDVKHFSILDNNSGVEYSNPFKFYSIEEISPVISEDAKRTAKLAGVDLTRYLGNYAKFYAEENKDKPSDPSEYPKVDNLEFKNPELIDTNVDFHDSDDMEYQKFATGEDVASETKIDVPENIKKQVDKRIQELKDAMETHDERGFDLGSRKGKVVDVLEKMKKWLEEGSLKSLMDAQILYSTLANQYAVLIPPRVINFLHTSLFKYSKDNFVNLDHPERKQTNQK